MCTLSHCLVHAIPPQSTKIEHLPKDASAILRERYLAGTFSVVTQWSLAFFITGAVSIPMFGQSLDLWLQDLWSHYRVYIITPNTSNILGDVILRLGLKSSDAGTICLQFVKKVSISNNVHVIWMLHINENLYINTGSMLIFSIGNVFSRFVWFQGAFFTTHTQYLFDQSTDENSQ